MKTVNWKVYAFWIAVCEAVGAVAGWLTAQGTRQYNALILKPDFSPPGWVFPVAWALLYALMGISAARISLLPDCRLRSRGLNLFVTQLTVNFFWPLLFFNAQAFGFAFFWLLLLLALVVVMSWVFRAMEHLAGWLQLPYILWLCFAAVLNFAVWRLN